jgi:hypothetical protein
VASLKDARTLATQAQSLLGLRVNRKGETQYIVIREDGKNE